MATATAPATAPTTKKGHSKLAKQEITQLLNQLHAPPSFETNAQCVDIIAVPGLGSDMTYTWVSGGVHWLKDENMLPKAIPNARISVFGYRSQWYGPDAVEIPLSQVAHDLLHAIRIDRKEQKGKLSKKRPIVFVGHSLGGLVIAKAITKAKRQPEDYPDIIGCITACVFLGTPFRGSDSQPLAKLIGRAGEVLGIAKYNSLVKALKSGSRELEDLADDFLGDVSKVQIDLECYFETEATNGYLIADQKSSTFEGKPRHSWARNHSQMNKFDSPKDNLFKDISTVLGDHVQQSFKKIRLRQDALRREITNDSRVEKILDALDVVNPKKDLERIRRINSLGKETMPTWMQDEEKYLTWKNDSSSWILWICGDPGKGKTIAALSMVQEMSKLQESRGDGDDSVVFAYFFCDEGMRDKSKALNVLKCLAWQLVKAKRHLVRYFFEEDNKAKGGAGPKKPEVSTDIEFRSLPELWKCFKSALSDPSIGSVYFIINGLDQIDSASRIELLSLITSFQPQVSGDDGEDAGPQLRWLFLSVRRDDIKEALEGVPTLDLDDGSHSTKQDDDLRAYVGRSISRLAVEKGYSRSLEYFVKSFISLRAKGKSNYSWVDLVCLELSNTKLAQNAVRPLLEFLPSDLYPMYDEISRRVLSMTEIEAGYVKDILRALLLVHWPPTLEELAVIAGLPDEDQTDHQAIKNWIGSCGALVMTFKVDSSTKVQLSHTSVRDFLKSKADNWLSIGSEQIQHGIMALRCFDYVLRVVEQAESDEQSVLDDPEEENDDEEDTEDDDDDDDDDDDNDDNNDDDDKNDDSKDIDNENDGDNEVKNNDDASKANSADRVKIDGEAKDQKDVKLGDENGTIKRLKPLRYCYTQWIEHALRATPDIVDNFGLVDVFWVLGSKERAKWSKSYSKLVSDPEPGDEFDKEFTSLHVAAYFGYVPLADLLLKKGTHNEEIHTVDSNGFQPLYWACRRGHMNMVQKLCEAKADVNFKQSDEDSELNALHGAASSGNLEIASYLLKHGAEIDAGGKSSGTALYIAAEKGKPDVVKLLIAAKADPNRQGGEELNPLNAAAKEGHLDIVQLLVENGAKVNVDEDYWYGNALHVACRFGHKEVVTYLLERGGDFNKKDSVDRTPLTTAAEYGFAEVVRLLKNDLDPESHKDALFKAVQFEELECVKTLLTLFPDTPRSDAFYEAASRGYTDIVEAITSKGVGRDVMEKSLYEATDCQYEATVRLLLDMGVDANAEGPEYGNALQASAYDGTTEILKMLLAKGAKVNQSYPDTEYGTALQAACYEGTDENVKILVEHGALVNPEKICGTYGTPLQAASFAGNTEIVQLLLENQADPNAKGGKYTYAIIAATEGGEADVLELLVNAGAEINVKNPVDGCTPLINAASLLPKSSVEFLINHGADIHAHDNDNDTALVMAAASGDAEMVEYLLEKESDISTIGSRGGALYRAIKCSAMDCVSLLLKHGINVDQEGGAMHTPLQLAASRGLEECTKILLDHGADVHNYGGKFHSPLQAAIHGHSVEITELLLSHGADSNAKGGKYGTALHAAVTAETDGSKLIDLLLEHGAEINAVTEHGTALHTACAMSETEAVQHLLDNSADPNIVGGKYETPLQAACYQFLDDEVTLLLERGADPKVKGGYYGSALNAAAASGSYSALDSILEEYQDVSPDMLVEALHYAAHYKESYTVDLLLEKKADVEAASHLYESSFKALEADLSSEEKKQKYYDNDDWFDVDDDNNDDDSSDNGSDAGDGKGDDGEDDNEDEDDDEEEEEDEDDAEEKEKIKKMLEDALHKIDQKSIVESKDDAPAGISAAQKSLKSTHTASLQQEDKPRERSPSFAPSDGNNSDGDNSDGNNSDGNNSDGDNSDGNNSDADHPKAQQSDTEEIQEAQEPLTPTPAAEADSPAPEIQSKPVGTGAVQKSNTIVSSSTLEPERDSPFAIFNEEAQEKVTAKMKLGFKKLKKMF